MIYAASAAFALGLLAWDIGRRWLSASAVNEVHRSHLAEVRGDLARVDDAAEERWERVLADLNKFEARCFKLETSYGDSVSALQLRVRELSDRIVALESAPVESPDVSALKSAIETQERALKGFWELIGKQFASKDELKSEVERLRAGQSAVLATGGMNGTRFKQRPL
jgi:hypothetical protein